MRRRALLLGAVAVVVLANIEAIEGQDRGDQRSQVAGARAAQGKLAQRRDGIPAAGRRYCRFLTSGWVQGHRCSLQSCGDLRRRPRPPKSAETSFHTPTAACPARSRVPSRRTTPHDRNRAAQKVAKRYPHKQASEVLNDLVATTPGSEGKWFAAARPTPVSSGPGSGVALVQEEDELP